MNVTTTCPTVAASEEYRRLREAELAAYVECKRLFEIGDPSPAAFEADRAAEAARDEAEAALLAVLKTTPASAEGAIVMLRCIMAEIAGAEVDAAFVGGKQVFVAMRAAIAVLEGDGA